MSFVTDTAEKRKPPKPYIWDSASLRGVPMAPGPAGPTPPQAQPAPTTSVPMAPGPAGPTPPQAQPTAAPVSGVSAIYAGSGIERTNRQETPTDVYGSGVHIEMQGKPTIKTVAHGLWGRRSDEKAVVRLRTQHADQYGTTNPSRFAEPSERAVANEEARQQRVVSDYEKNVLPTLPDEDFRTSPAQAPTPPRTTLLDPKLSVGVSEATQGDQQMSRYQKRHDELQKRLDRAGPKNKPKNKAKIEGLIQKNQADADARVQIIQADYDKKVATEDMKAKVKVDEAQGIVDEKLKATETEKLASERTGVARTAFGAKDYDRAIQVATEALNNPAYSGVSSGVRTDLEGILSDAQSAKQKKADKVVSDARKQGELQIKAITADAVKFKANSDRAGLDENKGKFEGKTSEEWLQLEAEKLAEIAPIYQGLADLYGAPTDPNADIAGGGAGSNVGGGTAPPPQEGATAQPQPQPAPTTQPAEAVITPNGRQENESHYEWMGRTRAAFDTQYNKITASWNNLSEEEKNKARAFISARRAEIKKSWARDEDVPPEIFADALTEDEMWAAIKKYRADKGKQPAEPPQEGATAPAQPQTAPVTSQADFDALPAGSEFIGPDGKKRRKP